MENEFLEVSENESVNLIYNANNLTVSDTLLHFACLDYMKTYKTNYVPFDYISYYIEKVKSYDRFFEENLAYFYDYVRIDKLDIATLASIYSKSIISIVVAVVTKDSIEFVVTDEDPVDLLSFYMESSTDRSDPVQLSVYNAVKFISAEMDRKHELLSKKELFEKYMIAKFLDSYTPSNVKAVTKEEIEETVTKKQEPAVTAVEKIAEKEINGLDESMKGKEVIVPEQKGKVTKLFIPKLLLPSQFPILQDTSRINSDYRAKSVSGPDKMINLFGKYKFKQVKYNTGFIEKRKKVKKPKPKFSFDF